MVQFPFLKSPLMPLMSSCESDSQATSWKLLSIVERTASRAALASVWRAKEDKQGLDAPAIIEPLEVRKTTPKVTTYLVGTLTIAPTVIKY